MVDIRNIDEGTWVLDEGGVRFFLLAGREKALLIDSGMETRNAKELAESLTDLPVMLLNTHADRDHIGSIAEFDRFYMDPAECSNLFHSQDPGGEVVPVRDGDVLDLGDRPLRIIGLPGHTPGSIAVLDENRRRLFSGDPIQTGTIFMFGVQREMHAYMLSLQYLWGFRDLFDEIYPSHETCPLKPELIMTLYEAAGKVMAGEVRGRDVEVMGHPAAAYDVGAAVFLCDRVG